MCEAKRPYIKGYVEYPGQELPYGWDWPEGVPRSYDDMVQVLSLIHI